MRFVLEIVGPGDRMLRSSSARLISFIWSLGPCYDLISSMDCGTIGDRSLLDVSCIITS